MKWLSSYVTLMLHKPIDISQEDVKFIVEKMNKEYLLLDFIENENWSERNKTWPIEREPNTKMGKDLVVKVERVDHGEYVAIDPDGVDRVNDIPIHALQKAVRNDALLQRYVTKNGDVQWRQRDHKEFEDLFKSASKTEDVNNTMSDEQKEIVDFIKHAPDMIPEHLMISDLKWKYLIRSVLRGKNILMTGPSGCGKTLVAQTLAEVFDDRPYFYFNLGSTQDARSALIGNTHFSKEDGTFVKEALFVKAISTPNAIILLDEFSRAHHDAVNILMTVLDPNQSYLRIDEHPDTPTINVAEGVTFIATANIGAEYTATRIIDRAILDRFQVIEMEPLDLDDEMSLLAIKYPDVDEEVVWSIAEIADHTRKMMKSDDQKVSTIVSTRQTVEMASLIYDGFTLEDAAEVCILPFYSDAGGMDSERTYMKQLIQKHVKSSVGSSDPWGS